MDLELGHILQLFAGLAGGEHDPDRLRQQAAATNASVSAEV
jgi:hypothetical protein